MIGYNESEISLVGDCVPLTVSRSPTRLYLSAIRTLKLDDSKGFLSP